ncbi:MFS-type transporter [Streptomyces venezuelae]|uniref:MFS transporter n=1 Tax=Streptomyces gardneri TaxID=66892 RepID=UPI0006BDD529|nr:MFS transporter [Streptomyces gardneri]ALO06297.1 MFS-type transporter [Streptomyces venezuelae]QPK43754.1 MFS transporter [Streptomyces gardneri]WRK35009.1 MFS transporter [Streptomyces venezuelae]CUM43448.1 major facilitator superfamily MFS_1 [Streptomyces venezuelae]
MSGTQAIQKDDRRDDERETSSPGVFWRYWAAATVSGAGTAVTALALPLVALTVLDATAFQVALLAAAGQVSWLLLSLPAGVVAQRVPLRRLQVTLDLVRFAALGSLPLVWWIGTLTYPHLLFAALVTGSATVLFDIGNSTFLPAVVPARQLAARNSVMSGTHAVTDTGGPSLGGVLIGAAGPVGALVVDAASYLASAVLLRTLPESRPAPRTGESALRLMREGWRYVTGHPVMRPCMIWATAANFLNAALVALTPLYLVREAGLDSVQLGLVLAMDGVGALAGAAVAVRVTTRLGTAWGVIAADLAGGALLLLAPLTTSAGDAYWFALGNAGFAFGTVIGSITTRTYRQTQSPPELLSRVMATVRFVSWGALPLGALTAGLLATRFGAHTALWTVCAAAFLPPVYLFSTKVGRHRDLI